MDEWMDNVRFSFLTFGRKLENLEESLKKKLHDVGRKIGLSENKMLIMRPNVTYRCSVIVLDVNVAFVLIVSTLLTNTKRDDVTQDKFIVGRFHPFINHEDP
jgi:hypothetical protein